MRRAPLETEDVPLAPALPESFSLPARELPTPPELAPPRFTPLELAPLAFASTGLSPAALASLPALAESPPPLAAPAAACEPEPVLEHAPANEHAKMTANAPDEARLDRSISTPALPSPVIALSRPVVDPCCRARTRNILDSTEAMRGNSP